MKLLIAEDDPKLLKSLMHILESHKFSVDGVNNGDDALNYGLTGEYDGLIFDIMMPGMDGIQVLQSLRASNITTPALFLTARTEVSDRVAGLDAGADDYLPKPFSTVELLARIRAMLRRKDTYLPDLLTVGAVTLNRSTYQLSFRDQIQPLSGKEFQILEMLMQQPGLILPSERFITHLWGWDTTVDTSVIWVHISNLRKKSVPSTHQWKSVLFEMPAMCWRSKMIGSLRKKFISISIISIFLVFSGLFFFLLVFTRIQTNRSLDVIADTIASNDGVFPEFDPAQRHPPIRLPYSDVITEETQFSTRFFSVLLDDQQQITDINVDSVSTITEQDVEEFTEQALRKAGERGWISDYRYKVMDTEDGTIVVFVNGVVYQNMANRLLFTALLVLLGSAALILILTVVVSKWAVRPVAESYEKQRQFITDANHELKTPLTLILSNLDIIEAEIGQNEWLDDIRSEGERMGLLINQLVTLSRMDESTDSLTRADFNLSSAIADTVSEFQNLAEERHHDLTSSIPPSIHYYGDEALIRRLTAILLDNAIKYCDLDGSIQLSLTVRRYPILTIENTYKDVDHLELNRLFDRFYRADKARTFSGSFGIGLSIAQSIVKSHKGNLSAYKKSGTIGFRVELK